MSRAYNSEPARFARVLLVINTVRPRIGLSPSEIRESVSKRQDVFAVTDHALIVALRYLFLAVPLVKRRLLNVVASVNSVDNRAQSLELQGRASSLTGHFAHVSTEIHMQLGVRELST